MTVKRTMLRTVALGCLLAGTAAISGGTRPALAQDNASLNGVVLEQGTDRPLAGAIVAVIEGDLSVKTSPDGGFAFASLTVGDATLRVTLDGYASLVEPFGALPEGTTFVQLRLLPLAVAVEEIIASVPGFARNSAPGTLVRGTGDDPRTLADLLQGVVGLDLNRNQGSAAGGARVQVRGANSMSLTNEPMFYVNGIRISARAGDMHSLEMIPASWVKQVRVLRGPSAQYPDAFNGVVLIETDPGRAP